MTFSVMMLKVCHYNSVEYENKTLPRRKLQFFSPFVLFFYHEVNEWPYPTKTRRLSAQKKGLTFCIFSRQKRRHCRHQPNCLTPACLPATRLVRLLPVCLQCLLARVHFGPGH